ncbi:HTTM domain-containing protein [Streptomyces flavofungini]|uniref:HTTM domain-containing protein n=1 Tax=Streptomyces flavofungini TaxID=68200 RepID=A0ABS0WY38_9ACTN|nr:HTTM domain-containing protein [Streptomyces flavofungini]MBJ3805852.1 HTTM domain-containing protein [Streptomyces flavofungini]GHC75685.1 HTTM domain-containing protein [Streptomyces flavofungini]
MSRFAPLAQGVQRVTAQALGPYQTAVVRIGFAATWLLFLLRELPHRRELYGPDGPWSWDMARQLISANDAFTALMWSDGRVWFEIVYFLAIVSSALLVVGWRTRTMSVLFMIGVLSLQNRSIFMGDGGDNVIHLMAIYLVFTRCGQVWSLDARRAARARGARLAYGDDGNHADDGSGVVDGSRGDDGDRADRGDRVGPVLWWVLGLALSVVTFMGELTGFWLLLFWGLWAAHGLWWVAGRRAPNGEPRVLLDVVANLAHNAALLVIMVEACLIYATAGWYKIQGSRWQDGTAVYYPLQLDYFSPWPALADLLTSHGVLVMLVTYGTVAVQVAFPFTLFNRRVKNVLLAVMIFEHAVIAVVLGLPFFSLAMIAADAVFLPTSFLRRLGGWATRAREGLLSRVPRRSRTEASPEPPGEEHTRDATEHARVGFGA